MHRVTHLNRGKRSRRYKPFRLCLSLLCLLLLLTVTACGGQQEEAENGSPGDENEGFTIEFPEVDREGLTETQVVAKYEDGEIRGDELARYLAIQALMQPHAPVNDPEIRERFLQFLIAERLILEEMAGADLDWAEAEAEQLWHEVQAVYDEETLERAYETLDISEEDVKQYLHNYAVIKQYFREQLTEEERTKATVRHILISTMHDLSEEEARQKAYDLYEQLEQGADFAELAREHSQDPGSKEDGGLYEDVPVAMWVPEFKQAALEQEIGVIGEPVQTDYGFHIIKVEKRYVAELDELEPDEISQLTGQKFFQYLEEELPQHIKHINL
ncbi:PpiC-type peptidyl-prolyl cis-trans isomerase [Caldalkalibacillus thermarum TA2.A1]|uniref:Peptidylprolyl isomerase n=1 Tax=Caldalkalibacillus thermarum (strain TA2.A1) TaxID=986075 RepID=F5L9Z5_CALTT|nr:peptidylprolyl isomerase [Caldalkalibacillus thermarum]EGL81865.1 PpiC-type peptidyl-prolyl cis-trans isomerase [Caldalkalibacillus thermarum TA2.A1]QZT34352.1 peptidylprolyl isomerase [Caldalkalibacillus thermarum TA2.A1]